MKLGPYELIDLLGAGGMGEVYRARDTRLGREVAVKVLPRELASDPERLRRFELEARAIGALNHPNILSVHDLGNADGVVYLVMELLDGETLRERLSGMALPVRKAVDYATQIAEGLAAAHAAHIVHRDLKPENLFVTKDGRIKILDFGLAKLTPLPSLETTDTVDATRGFGTTPGVVLGTIGYLSPEQVRGEPADHRSDIFSFGAILYEMLTGRRAFRGPTQVETMTAILRHEPEEVSASGHDVDPGIERVVRRCLEKSPEERFQSARDLAFNLGELASLSESGVRPSPTRSRVSSRRQTWVIAALGAVLAVASGAIGFLLGGRGQDGVEIDYRQLTFRRGTITAARFAPDGGTVVYSAIWDGGASEVYTTSPGNPESRPLGLEGAGLLGISPSGEMAVSLRLGPPINGFERVGTLANLPLATSTAPRELIERVRWADWDPRGSDLAVVRLEDGRSRLDFPAGKTILETPSWISHPRVSPDGQRVAFLEHPQFGDDRGFVAVVDRSGDYRRIGGIWSTIWGLAWHPDGKEIWFTGGPEDALAVRRLYAVTLDGTPRLLAISPGELTLHDVSASGDVLLSVEDRRRSLIGFPKGASHERNLTWLDRSIADDLSPGGDLLLFHEGGKAGAVVGSLYIRALDGSPAVRLAEGYGIRFSPDLKWVVSFIPTVPRQWRLVPTGAGSPRPLDLRAFASETVQVLGFAPDSRRLLVWGTTKDGNVRRIYVLDPDTGEYTPLSSAPDFPRGGSDDGRWVVANDEEGHPWLIPVDGDARRPIAGLEADDQIAGLSADARTVYLAKRSDRQAEVYRLDVETGAREPLYTLSPPGQEGLAGVGNVLVTPDGQHYVYGYTQQLSELYLARGIR